MRLFSLVFMLFILILCKAAYSYKEATHKVLSRNSLTLSYLSVAPFVLRDLGLKPFSDEQKFTNPDDPEGIKLTIDTLIQNGAEFEDRLPRSLNHFYNPVNNEPLTIGVPSGSTSPDWVLEDTGDIDPGLTGRQDYSYKDAMNYFHLALTSQTEDVRDQNWGRVFQTLGQVIHHVQDMAQPDHVRNDQHLDGIDSSWYEEYTNDHKGDANFINLMNINPSIIPEFPLAREYWTTRDTDTVIANRRGLADFTNRNFVSKDTIFEMYNGVIVAHAEYPFPVPDITPNSVDIADPSILGAQGQALCDNIKSQSIIPFPVGACFLDFVSTPVTGALAGEATMNNRAASYSIFDKKLQDHNVDAIYTREDDSIDTIDRSFTLNEFNFNAAHSYLIPRAVAFSAGLLDHFFRGWIQLSKDFAFEIPDGWQISSFVPEEMEGVFTLYYDDVNGIRKPVPGAVWDTAAYGLNGVLEAFGLMEVPSFTLPVDRANGQLLLVFKGRIGQEGNREGLNNDFVTAAYNYQLPKYRHAEIELPLWDSIVDMVDNTRDYTSIAYALFVHNETIYEFKTEVSHDASYNVVTFNNYYIIRYLSDGSVSVIDFTAQFDCYYRVQYVLDGETVFYRVGQGGMPCGDRISGTKFNIEIPTDDQLLLLPFGYQVQSWNMGMISRFDVHNTLITKGKETVKFYGTVITDNIWIAIDRSFFRNTSSYRLSDGSCNSLELKHVDPSWEYFNSQGDYRPNEYYTPATSVARAEAISNILNFSREMIMETRCNR